MLSLIQISRLSEDLAYQANAAKILAPFAAEASAAHLKNMRTLYVQLGEALMASGSEAPAPQPFAQSGVGGSLPITKCAARTK